jgi:predicted kinase
MSKIPKVYVLVGVPGSGKSTWIAQQEWARDCVVVSTDRWIEVFARELGRTYSEVFDLFMPAAVRAMSAQVALAQQQGRDIVWDQTSVSVASRAKKFASLPDYEHVAVVFATPEPAELARRLDQRPGKTIPDSVMKSMIYSFEQPTLEEGFAEIWRAQ